MSKFRPNNHVIGKVYDLTQDNFNALMQAWEIAEQAAEEYRELLRKAMQRVTSLQKALHEANNLAAEGKAELSERVNAMAEELHRVKGLCIEKGHDNARLREALELVAAPKRPDGTYNRCREACEELARTALARQELKKDG